jgi:hypothetical protein
LLLSFCPRNLYSHRWNNYKPLDKLIEHTPFLCFKTPLRTSTLQSVVKEDWFRIDELLSMSRKHGKLHTVIALSGTTKYYDFEELEKKNVCCLTMIGIWYVHRLNFGGFRAMVTTRLYN